MKIIITENKFKDTIKLSLKELGTKSTIDNVGGWENFCTVLNIDDFMDFLHLFDDLEVVQSDEEENLTLFRYKKGSNLMVYDRKSEYVYIDYSDIWSFLEDGFGLNYSKAQAFTKRWVDEAYNLRGVTTTNADFHSIIWGMKHTI